MSLSVKIRDYLYISPNFNARKTFNQMNGLHQAATILITIVASIFLIYPGFVAFRGLTHTFRKMELEEQDRSNTANKTDSVWEDYLPKTGKASEQAKNAEETFDSARLSQIARLTREELEKKNIDRLVELCDEGELEEFCEYVENFVNDYLEHRWGENWIEKNTACEIGKNWEKAREEIKKIQILPDFIFKIIERM